MKLIFIVILSYFWLNYGVSQQQYKADSAFKCLGKKTILNNDADNYIVYPICLGDADSSSLKDEWLGGFFNNSILIRQENAIKGFIPQSNDPIYYTIQNLTTNKWPKYKKAQIQLIGFKSFLEDTSGTYVERQFNGKTRIEKLKKLSNSNKIKTEKGFEIEKWKHEIIHPTLSASGHLMVFTSRENIPLNKKKSGKYQLFKSSKKDGKWTQPTRIDITYAGRSILQQEQDFLFPFIADNGKLFFSTISYRGTDFDIYSLDVLSDVEGDWGKGAMPCPEPINSKFDDYQYTEFRALYKKGAISSNREGSNDIFFFSKKRDYELRFLIVCNTDYESLPDLNFDTTYIDSLAKILISDYGFSNKSIILKNKPVKLIKDTMEFIKKSMTPSIQLLTIWIGHGDTTTLENQKTKEWIFKGTNFYYKHNKPRQFISAQQISDFLWENKAEKCILIADVCRAGFLLKKIEKYPVPDGKKLISVLTSGNKLRLVPGNDIFIKRIITILNKNIHQVSLEEMKTKINLLNTDYRPTYNTIESDDLFNPINFTKDKYLEWNY